MGNNNSGAVDIGEGIGEAAVMGGVGYAAAKNPTVANNLIKYQTVSFVIGGILVIGFLVTFMVVFLIAKPQPSNNTPTPP